MKLEEIKMLKQDLRHAEEVYVALRKNCRAIAHRQVGTAITLTFASTDDEGQEGL